MIVGKVYAATGVIDGELKVWHTVTITFDGPNTNEQASDNPFLNYRLNVTFTNGNTSYVVPGYYAADGNASNTSADSGNKWRVKFTPNKTGTWTYKVSFRKGNNIAINDDVNAGQPVSFDGETGSFNITQTDKSGSDFRAKGRLNYVGENYLQFEGTGKYYIKGGADSPENFLAFKDFDQTPTNKHHYNPHANDWKNGDPTWKGTKGKNIIGALNYLAGKGMNSVYFLTMNVNGDGKDVWPWTSSNAYNRFDCSKLDQWEIVFSHMDKLGLLMHVITQETENDQLLNGGALGTQRKLYYRELIARFSHHLGLVWNLGEENTNTDAELKAFSKYFKEHDPYKHMVVVHTYPGQKDKVFTPLLGYQYLDGPSLQMGSVNDTHATVIKWLDKSANAGRPWVVNLDEQGPANVGVKPDKDDYWHDDIRKKALWGTLMAGGAGCEWYFGYHYDHDDLDCQDWRSRDHMWDLTRYALEFFQKHLPFTEMSHNDGLTSHGSDYCFAKPGKVYAIYLPSGGTTNLNLESYNGTYDVKWYNPRQGGNLQNGTVTTITGFGNKAIGYPPNNTSYDWVALVTLKEAGPTPDILDFTPTEDVYIENTTTHNVNVLKVQQSSSQRTVYLKFNVTGVTKTVDANTLTLTCTSDGGTPKLRVYAGSSSNWTEASINSGNAPTTGALLASYDSPIAVGQSVSLDLGKHITGNGTYTLIIKGNNGSNDAWFNASEAANGKPKLTLSLQ
ncbi:DUF5060 domain-containing protein [Vallitalea pronyensis]|uniref:DUF5060 domain-containing protein n=2 Tax=Vallitalea pronyensis TaxID=1348613 RepID=A0A8J8MQK2_9FIRM|nr:DUF5060 domain-containing protein [Vallitalea pronyensis]